MVSQFLANYDVTILDIMPVHIGDFVMIGPNTLITTVNHPLTPKGRREHLGIGNNVVIAAGAVVTKDVPDTASQAVFQRRKSGTLKMMYREMRRTVQITNRVAM